MSLSSKSHQFCITKGLEASCEVLLVFIIAMGENELHLSYLTAHLYFFRALNQEKLLKNPCFGE